MVRTGVNEWVVHFFSVVYATLKCVFHSLPPVLEGIRQQVAKNTKNSFDDFTVQAQKQIWHKRNIHMAL